MQGEDAPYCASLLDIGGRSPYGEADETLIDMGFIEPDEFENNFNDLQERELKVRNEKFIAQFRKMSTVFKIEQVRNATSEEIDFGLLLEEILRYFFSFFFVFFSLEMSKLEFNKS